MRRSCSWRWCKDPVTQWSRRDTQPFCRGGLCREAERWWRNPQDPVLPDSRLLPLQEKMCVCKTERDETVHTWQQVIWFYTQNVGSSGVVGCWLTELQQTEDQLHQHTVSRFSCTKGKERGHLKHTEILTDHNFFMHRPVFLIILWHSLSSSLICPLWSCSCLVSCFSPSSLVSGKESQDVTDRKWVISFKRETWKMFTSNSILIIHFHR